MTFVAGDGSLLGCLVATGQDGPGTGNDGLSRCQAAGIAQFLHLVAIDIRLLISNMKDQPQLETRIGIRNSDSMVRRETSRVRYIGVVIPVEGAPDLVVSRWLSSRASSVLVLPCYRPLDQGEWCAVKRIDDHIDPVATFSGPTRDVRTLCYLAFGEDENRSSLGAERYSPAWGRWSFRHASASTAARSNSPMSRTGTAPYRPCR